MDLGLLDVDMTLLLQDNPDVTLSRPLPQNGDKSNVNYNSVATGEYDSSLITNIGSGPQPLTDRCCEWDK